ncbi:hypothetical protein GCM10023116_03370 [Kistimonas scapharcae]|uniref:Aminoglycoside phosphotransferase domain-containing protein n=1 Tax=Kistimonas scapharcae TaxID=1036133 RepID=A0ABP8UVZ1_9GAMM
MASEIIPLLYSRHYLNAYNQVPEGLSALTHIARLRWQDNQVGRYFVKIYPRDYAPLGLVNEITGYLLALACGIPQPPRAAVVHVPSAVFGQLYPQFEVPDDMMLLGWATEEYGGKTLKTYLGRNMQSYRRILHQLAKWSHLPALLAFDDWLANQDRNTGNVVVRSDKDFGVIDHGGCPVKHDWTAEDLDPNGRYESKLLDEVFSAGNPLQLASGMVDASQQHSEAYTKVVTELQYWWRIFREMTEHNRQALENFLTKRAANGPDRITATTGLLRL